MATFAEMMDQFRNPGESPVDPVVFAGELETVFNDEISTREAAITERDNRIAEKENALIERDKELQRVKAVNYDKFMAAPNPGEPENQDANENAGDRPRGIAALFE